MFSAPAPAAGPTSEAEQIRNLIKDIDVLLSPLSADRIRNFTFSLDGINCQASRTSAGDGVPLISIVATLGNLPFSAESVERRQALLEILTGAKSLFHVRFGLDKQHRIIAAGNFAAAQLASSDFIFYPLMLFLQEARPFFTLIGRYI